MLSVMYDQSLMSGKKEVTATMKANVRVSIRDDFASFCREKGEIQADTLGTLIEWFMDLPDMARIAVMAKLKAGDRVAVAKLALQRIIESEAADESPPKSQRRVGA